MGCCVSTKNNESSPFQKQQQQHFEVGSHQEALKTQSSNENRAPPPPSSLEEETVKEVLSETPKPKPKPKPPPQSIRNSRQELEHQHQDSNRNKKIHIEPPPSPTLPFLEEKAKDNTSYNKNEKIFQEDQEISEQEASEVGSYSLSESVSTTLTFNNDDQDQEVNNKQRVMRSPTSRLQPRNRAISGDRGPKRDRVVGKSPTRRSDQSPGKRNNSGGRDGSVRLVQSRESGTGQVGLREGLRSNPNRRDPGESSGRRSRSPAAIRSPMGRSPSTRRTNRSPGRFRADPNESGDSSSVKVESGMEGNKWPSTASAITTTNESLENPLVSLECFIFL